MVLKKPNEEVLGELGKIKKTIHIHGGVMAGVNEPIWREPITVPSDHLNEAKEILQLLEDGNLADFMNMRPVNGLTLLTVCATLDSDSQKNAVALYKRTQTKSATIKRGEKYSKIQAQLKLYWVENIDPKKAATDAAIILMKSSIYLNSPTKPKQSQVEKYIREWKK